MSGEQQKSSFGDPSAQPPTPKQTPTSVVFPSPVFQTPVNNQGFFEGFQGGTPRFAEEYSVFNSTPGNLRGSQGPFVDYAASTPYQYAVGCKRPLSAGGVAAEIAAHVNHFSPDPNLPLPPVIPSQRLPSSADPPAGDSSQNEGIPASDSQANSSKKFRREQAEELETQTATPPPSARKSARKIAPKLQMNNMQNEHGFPPEFVVGTPQQQGHVPHFVTTPTDMFGYPLSAPATAPVFTDSRPFWDNDASMNGMEIDFANASAQMFQHHGHRPMASLDWGAANEIFQENGFVPQQNHESNLLSRRERPLAPKPPTPNPQNTNQNAVMHDTSFVTPVGDPFGMMTSVGGVDPGLLFTRPPSSNMENAAFNPLAQPALMPSMPQSEALQSTDKPTQRAGVRRTANSKDITIPKKPIRAAVSSPIKPTVRPGLSRSFSENRGRTSLQKAALPTLAPAIKPVSQQASGSRPVSQSSRSSGRKSPAKHHHRLSSLTSIPETVTPKTKTAVKFTIDSRGRARAETTTTALGDDDDEDVTPKARRSINEVGSRSKSWDSAEETESSSDDEPIIIPSRNTSFALPDPNKPTSTHLFPSLRRSFSEQSASSLGIYYNEPDVLDNDNESEAETEVNETAGSRGDAASELRKVVETRQKRASFNRSQNFEYRPPRSSASTISPTSFTDASLPTPSQGNSIRCVCQRTESPRNSDGFMVQCESCEHWLHGKCTNISRKAVPSVYICAFCANTPNAHGLRGRQQGRSAGGMSRKPAASPLAHKSFKSFR